jgi:hypothetical protein
MIETPSTSQPVVGWNNGHDRLEQWIDDATGRLIRSAQK